MEFIKNFDAKQVEVQINAVVDQFEKGTNSVLAYVQPESVRETLTNLNKASFDFARTQMATAKSFGAAFEKVSKDFTKNWEKATKTA